MVMLGVTVSRRRRVRGECSAFGAPVVDDDIANTTEAIFGGEYAWVDGVSGVSNSNCSCQPRSE